jgi:hypothetical protein
VESLEPALERVERQGVVERASAQSSAARRTDRTETSGRRNGERAETAGLRAETAGPRSDGPGRREAPALPRRTRPTGSSSGTAGTTQGSAAATQGAESGASPLPRRVRQANLAPQLKDGPERRAERDKARTPKGADLADRDADEVRSRMASLQRGWQRGREKNAAGDGAQGGTAPGTTKGDGR